jgi:hypothetical protein
MKNFCIRAKGNDEADSYWISAVSKEEARRLVALNIIGAAGVGEPAKFALRARPLRLPFARDTLSQRGPKPLCRDSGWRRAGRTWA